MGKTTIEWTDYSWNPVTGCTPVSEGCRNCYARRIAHRLSQNPAVPHRERHEGFRVSCWPERLEEPLRWRKPRTVFVCSMGDIFHSNVPTDFIDKVLEIIAACPQHTFLMLTKRPENIEDKLYGGKGARVLGGGDYLPNLGLGVTVENQDAVKRILHLLKTPAAMRFVSIEPMLGPVNLTAIIIPVTGPGSSQPCAPETYRKINALTGDDYYLDWHGRGAGHQGPKLDWVICGGETGPDARPMHPDWVRSLRDQCQSADVPFFFKSWGEWVCRPWSSDNGRKRELCLGMDGTSVYAQVGHMMGFRKPGEALMVRVGKKAAGRLLDGQIWDQRPEVSP